MPTPGPWIQGEDYVDEAFWSRPSDTFGVPATEYEGRWGGTASFGKFGKPAYEQIRVSDASSAFGFARDSLHAFSPDVTMPTTWTVDMRWVYRAGSVGLSNWDSYARADVSAEVWNIAPVQDWHEGEGFSPFSYTPPGMPAEAVGFELEGDGVPQPLAVAIGPETYLRGVGSDNSDGGPTPLPRSFTSYLLDYTGEPILDGAKLNHPVFYDGDTLGLTTSLYPLDTTLDISHLLGDDGTGAIWMRTLDFLSPLSGNPPIGNDGGPWRWGWEIQFLSLLWTLHPPRHRWIYEGEEPESYRRIFPVDRGRTYPPSKAFGRGGRRGGGYL